MVHQARKIHSLKPKFLLNYQFTFTLFELSKYLFKNTIVIETNLHKTNISIQKKKGDGFIPVKCNSNCYLNISFF